jgi:hypothetical protein
MGTLQQKKQTLPQYCIFIAKYQMGFLCLQIPSANLIYARALPHVYKTNIFDSVIIVNQR